MCAALLERFATVIQRPNTEEGKRQYKADVDLWHVTHGPNATPSLDKPYPLCPGTAAVGVGKCFQCRELTDLRHQSSNCDRTEQAPPLEARWRQAAAAMLRWAAQVQPPAPPLPVQYVWTGYNQNPMVQSTQTPVYAVNTSDGQMAGGGYWDEPGLVEGNWDTENDKGLQAFVDQL